ncbi:hypothetical protein Sjap_022385 [Stephania japonica]|uniref:Uncharacterized protein n=1 Tax=Stephania japonica TaxID=461633 RepID=A0AAP0EUH7_9MAGN
MGMQMGMSDEFLSGPIRLDSDRRPHTPPPLNPLSPPPLLPPLLLLIFPTTDLQLHLFLLTICPFLFSIPHRLRLHLLLPHLLSKFSSPSKTTMALARNKRVAEIIRVVAELERGLHGSLNLSNNVFVGSATFDAKQILRAVEEEKALETSRAEALHEWERNTMGSRGVFDVRNPTSRATSNLYVAALSRVSSICSVGERGMRCREGGVGEEIKAM